MEAYLLDWLNLLGRWLHLITGIAWIGASFYFVWLDNHLLPPKDSKAADKGVGGELWAVHGGGFYHAQKYRVAPGTLPEPLHWFKWEAYWTWMSGFFMLCLVYYVGADLYLIDKSVAAIDKTTAIAIGLGTLVGGWVVYDRLCASPLGKNDRALGAVLAILLIGAAYGLCHVFSGRGAFIHFGAMLGTIMVANVFFVIIPGQRELVTSKLEGREPDPIHGLRGKQRSVHNTYFTLPVLFTMLSNHYAMLYSGPNNWLVLAAISFAGAAIRVFFVARHKGKNSPLPVAIGVLILGAVVFAMAPSTSSGKRAATASAADEFVTVRKVIQERCVSCHATAPTQAGFEAPPKGVAFDTPESIVAQAAQIRTQVASKAMPIGNLTQMTDEERAMVIGWVNRGAAK